MGRRLKDPEKIAARIEEKIKPANKAKVNDLKTAIPKVKSADQTAIMKRSMALSTAAGRQDSLREELNDAFYNEAKQRIKDAKAAEREARKPKKK